MNHLYAGAVVGGIAAGCLAVTFILWWFLGLFVGPMNAAALTILVLVIVAGTTALDYITERMEK